MSASNTPPTNETTQQASTDTTPSDTPQAQNGIAIPRDIRSDNLDPATKGEASKILGFNIFEKRAYLVFKIAAFIVIILLGAYFLHVGLRVSTQAIGHIKEIQVAQLKQNSEKVELAKLVESNKLEQAKAKAAILENSDTPVSSSASTQPKPVEKEAETVKASKEMNESKVVKDTGKTEKKETKEPNTSSDSLGSAMVSTGSIVTLIAFILGTGLTLLLTLLKFTFTANEPTNQNQNDCVTVAGPLSELLQSIADYIKKKIGLN